MSKPLASAIAAIIASSTLAALPALAQKAAAPYQLSVFAKAPTGSSAPDSIAVVHDHVFVGYGDGNLPDGSDGKSTQIVEYTIQGGLVRSYTVKGHNDGLKVNPSTGHLWALQNEDANANLVIIDPESQQQSLYSFGPTMHGGGYDDIVFSGCGEVYISASNPANNPNTGPAIVRADIVGNYVDVAPVLAGEATAIDVPTDSKIKLNLQDPDSMTLDPEGDLVLDSQADQELIIVSRPGPSQRVLRLPLSYRTGSTLTPVEVDDTAFVTSTQGFILFADKGLNTVYKLSRQAFVPGSAFTAADGGPFVGTVDMTTGVITPIVTGLNGPGGLVYVSTAHRDPDALRDRSQSCHDDRSDGRSWER